MAATPEKLGLTSKATKNASQLSTMLSFKTMKGVHVTWLEEIVSMVRNSVKSSPGVAGRVKWGKMKVTYLTDKIVSFIHAHTYNLYKGVL